MSAKGRKIKLHGDTQPVFLPTVVEESDNYYIVLSPERDLICLPKCRYGLVPEPTLTWVDITDKCAVEDGHLFDQTNPFYQRLICGPNAPIAQGYRLTNVLVLNAAGRLNAFGVERQDMVQL